MTYKKIVAAVSAILICIGTFSERSSKISAEGNIYADLSGGGKVNSFDVILCKKALIKGIVNDEIYDMDVNGDFDAADLKLLNKCVLNVDTGLIVSATAPVFSTESGFYDEEFMLNLTSDTIGGKIFYTTDGSDPTIEALRYKGDIRIYDRSNEKNVLSAKTGCCPSGEYIPSLKVDKSMVIKAVTCDTKGNISDIVTKSYFIGTEIKEKYSGIPVISISTDEENLFGYENGIFVLGKTFDDWMQETGGAGYNSWEYPANYNQRGSEWEREVHIDLFENDGNISLSQDVGMRTMGNASRSNNQKSLRFYAREEYSGTKNIKYNLIPGLTKECDDTTPLNKFKTFVLRSGGNDADYSKLRDAYIQDLVSNRDFDTQGSRPVIAFINGEYWGVYNMQEDYNDNYVENNYGVNNDDVVMIKCGDIEEGNDEDLALYSNLLSFAGSNDLSMKENYDTICEMMDINNFIDYYCAELYIGNRDWMNYCNNFRLWRTRTVSNKPYYDGKWRWMLYDTEFSLGLYNDGREYNHDTLSYIRYNENGALNEYNVLFESLLKNDEFKQKFVTTFMDIANINFQPEKATTILNEMASIYEPLMNDSYKRFGPAWVVQYYNPPKGYFNEEIGNIKSYMNKRYDYVPSMLKDGLDLTGNVVDVNLSINNSDFGTLKINTSTLEMSSTEWSGKYFTDYPVTITAVAKEGHKFAGWGGDIESADSTITVTLNQEVNIYALFD